MPSSPSRKVSKSGSLVLLIVAAAVAGGCRSENAAVKRSQQAADLLVDTRQSLVVCEQGVATSQTSLRTLGDAKGDLRPTFALFVVELDSVRKQADRVAHESDAVKSGAVAYCAARKNDIGTIGNDALRQTAEQRAAKVKQQCDDINGKYAQVNAAYGQYINHLADLQTYLANDLNRGALESGQRWVDEALASGELLRGLIRDLALQVDMTSNSLSPVPIATTQWPTQLRQPDALASGR